MHELCAAIIRVFVVQFVDGNPSASAQHSLDELSREVGLDDDA
jgi:hypothetical protein